MPPHLVLASGSPRRRELLAHLGVPYRVEPSNVEEGLIPNLTPPELALALAERKARAIAAQFPEDTVIGADTLVEFAGEVLNKPVDQADAIRMLRLLTGNSHQVHTGICVCRGSVRYTRAITATVHMRHVDEREIAAYVASGEPMDKAGAYAAQGAGAGFVERVDGSFLAVVGLPLLALRELLLEAGEQVPADVGRLERLERGEAPA